VPHGELMAENGSIPSRNKKRSNLKECVTNGATDKVNDKK